MAITDKSAIDAVSMEVLSAYVQAYLAENAVLLNTVLDVSIEAEPGADKIKFPKITTNLTAEEDKGDGAGYTAQGLVWGVDSLDLNKQAGCFVEMTDLANLQAAIEQEPAIIREASRVIMAKMEAAVYAQIKAVAVAHDLNLGTASTLAIADILNARTALRTANVPFDNDLFLAINPAQEAQILGLPNFVNANQYGQESVINSNEIGKIYGFRVIVSNNVEAAKVLAYHRTHVAIGIQQAISFEKARDLKNAKTQFLMQAFYGTKVLDSGVRGVLLQNA
jgi:N4-gp56 family major capsid protein